MELSTTTQETLGQPRPLTRSAAAEPRWDLAFMGILGYLLSGAIVSVLHYPHLWLLPGLSAGLSTVCARKHTESDSSERLSPNLELVAADL